MLAEDQVVNDSASARRYEPALSILLEAH